LVVGEAMRDVGGILVLDCIASGAIWADMKDLGVDVVISAPQKGWTGPCCCAMIMMSDHAKTTMDQQSPDNKQSSYALSLPKWTTVMDKCKCTRITLLLLRHDFRVRYVSN
jgi:aspartate aminotransferase-like enzyme